MIPMQHSLTQGPITKNILLFALPLMFGNLLQQMYNIADTWVVGRFLGADALAAVGSSYTLMTFLTSILLGLCMGSGAAVSSVPPTNPNFIIWENNFFVLLMGFVSFFHTDHLQFKLKVLTIFFHDRCQNQSCKERLNRCQRNKSADDQCREIRY